MRLIDADKLTKNLTYDIANHPIHGNFKITVASVRAAISNMPTIKTVSAVPVVRCPQCVHHEDNGYHFCNKWEHFLPDDSAFFCAFGKRKEGNT